MLELMRHLDAQRYRPLTYVVAASDTTSESQARARARATASGPGAALVAGAEWVRITRSREVGQSWLSSAFTTALASAESAHVVLERRPELVVCNGPGVCVPICLAAYVLRVCGARPRPTIVFCESFCRVRSLSLTGKLMYYLADRFVVHWPELQRRFPLSEYLGQVY